MSNRITAWFELPSDIECSEDRLYDLLSKVYPEYVDVQDNGARSLRNNICFCYFKECGLPGYAGIFIWDNWIVFEHSKESKELRRILKNIVQVFGAKEVWYSTELSMDALDGIADRYEDYDYDWKTLVKERSRELKELYEDDEDSWDGSEITFHHDNFWDID